MSKNVYLAKNGSHFEYNTISKKICLAKNGGHLEFFEKITKHKSACILKTVRKLPNFQKIFVSPKMVAI